MPRVSSGETPPVSGYPVTRGLEGCSGKAAVCFSCPDLGGSEHPLLSLPCVLQKKASMGCRAVYTEPGFLVQKPKVPREPGEALPHTSQQGHAGPLGWPCTERLKTTSISPANPADMYLPFLPLFLFPSFPSPPSPMFAVLFSVWKHHLRHSWDKTIV